jgi:hypothetical protein
MRDVDNRKECNKELNEMLPYLENLPFLNNSELIE